MRDFFAPQLPLEAAMAEAGAFDAVAPALTEAMTYVKIGLGPEAFVLKPYAYREGQTAASTATLMGQRLQRQVSAMLLAEQPMPAQVLPEPNKRYRGDYEHLARVDEWAVAEDEDPWTAGS